MTATMHPARTAGREEASPDSATPRLAAAPPVAASTQAPPRLVRTPPPGQPGPAAVQRARRRNSRAPADQAWPPAHLPEPDVRMQAWREHAWLTLGLR